jgi:hypothetical protein
MNVGPGKAARAEYENNLTVLKKVGVVAHFFHNGLSARHNKLGIFNFMATDHCENGVWFFSQCCGWVGPGFEPRRKTGFVTGPACEFSGFWDSGQWVA